MIKLFSFFTLYFTISTLQAQDKIDIAKVISGTYKCSATIGTFDKSDVQKDKATVRINKTGENKSPGSL